MKITIQKILKSKPNLFIYLFLFTLLILSLIRIMANEYLWTYDASNYSIRSMRLFNALTNNPFRWFKLLFSIQPHKAPMLIWLGQFFIPLGKAINSIPKGLLISILLTQYISLLLGFKAFSKLFKSKIIAIAGCVFMASTPLFISMTNHYLLPALKTLTVIWFIYIMAFTKNNDKLSTILHLIIAVCFATLIKASSLAFSIMPILATILILFKSKDKKITWNTKRHVIPLVLCFTLFFASISWYIRNFSRIKDFLTNDSLSNKVFGTTNHFFIKIGYWLDALLKIFFTEKLFLIVIMLFAAGIYFLLKKNKKTNQINIVALASLIQIILVLTVASSIILEGTRYMLGILPYIALLICWSLHKINKNWVSIFIIFVFLYQLIIMNLFLSYPVKYKKYYKHPLPQISGIEQLLENKKNEKKSKKIEKIINIACNDLSKNRLYITSRDLNGIYAPLLNFKHLTECKNKNNSKFIYLEKFLKQKNKQIDYADTKGVFNFILDLKQIQYYITPLPYKKKIPKKYTYYKNDKSYYHLTQKLLKYFRESPAFKKVFLEGYENKVVIFKRVEK